MSDLMTYVHTLADKIGPRPVSSEEEQESANQIADWLQEKQLDPQIEEFNCPTWTTWPYVVAYLLAAVSAALSYFHGAIGIVMLVVAIIALGLLIYERYFGGNLGSLSRKGISQNVVARYVPQSVVDDPRRRKVIVVAHYDTQRTRTEASPGMVNSISALQRVVLVCMILIPILMVVQLLPIDIIRKWVWLASCFVAIIPVIAAVFALVNQFVNSYPDGANNNASGVAVMMGVADEVTGGSSYVQSPAQRRQPRAVTHDVTTARESDIFPPETEIAYADDVPERNGEVEGARARRNAGPFKERARETTEPEAKSARRNITKRGPRSGAPTVGEVHRSSDVFARERPVEDEMPEEEYLSQESATSQRRYPVSNDYIESDEPIAQETAAPQRRYPVSDGYIAPEEPVTRTSSIPAPRSIPEPVRRSDELEKAADQPLTQTQQPQRKTSSTTSDVRAHMNWETRERSSRPSQQVARKASDKPDWWTRVEANRKQTALDSDTEAAVLKSRSKYADLPSTAYRRPEPEPEPVPTALREEPKEKSEAERQIDAIMDETKAAIASEEIPAAISGAITASTFTEHEDARKETSDAFSTLFGSEEIDASKTAEVPPVVQPQSGFEENYSEKKAAIPEHVDEEPKAPQLPKRDARLMHVPSLDGQSSGEFAPVSMTSDTTGAPLLINDFEFGAPQAAPISSEYTDTPQNPQFSGHMEAIPDNSGEIAPLSSAEEFTPFAAGNFGAGETGAFIPVGNTDMFAPIADEAADFFIEDADDSSREIAPTVGDFSAPASIDIPESRGRRFVDNIFHHGKGKDQESSASEWLGVDKDYSATKAGQDIGSWDNFDEGDEDDDWKGGASAYRGDDEREIRDARERVSSRAYDDLANKEVWFVALGANGADHAGMKEFLAMHHDELKGALIVNLDCLGAGEICYVESEGVGKHYQSDHRIQALIRKLAREADGNIEIDSLDWTDTDATSALAAGYRAITLMGFDRRAPVAWNQKTDRSDIIEASRLGLSVDLVTRIIQEG